MPAKMENFDIFTKSDLWLLNFYFEEEDETPELNVDLDDNDLDYEQYEQESIETELVGKWKTKR